jgi:hypothetical protein
MAAGLGFKDFTTGEVLTAADVDSYLMQGIWVFASAAARDAAVTSPQEGNFAYLKDTNVTTYYTGSAWANLDTTGMTNPMTTTGDTIYSSSGSTPARLGIGSSGQVLTVAGGVPSWATPAGGSSFTGASLTNATNAQSIANNTATKLTFDGEVYDTDAYANANDKFTIPSGKAGYYRINAQVNTDASTAGYRQLSIYKNGSAVAGFVNYVAGDDYIAIDLVFNLSVADYIEFYFRQTNGTSRNVYKQNASDGYWQLSYLGA